MGRNKDLRQKVESLKEQISRHRVKIAAEKQKPVPNQGSVHCWEREIGKLEGQVDRARRRLKREW